MRVAVFALEALCLAAPALAQDGLSMVSTWTGTAEGVGTMDGWYSGYVTFVITEQRGSAFKGYVLYPEQSREARNEFVGVVALDGRTVTTADEDGITTGFLIDPNTYEQCYFEAGEDAKVACLRLTRQP
jgi:hypothetical protein